LTGAANPNPRDRGQEAALMAAKARSNTEGGLSTLANSAMSKAMEAEGSADKNWNKSIGDVFGAMQKTADTKARYGLAGLRTAADTERANIQADVRRKYIDQTAKSAEQKRETDKAIAGLRTDADIERANIQADVRRKSIDQIAKSAEQKRETEKAIAEIQSKSKGTGSVQNRAMNQNQLSLDAQTWAKNTLKGLEDSPNGWMMDAGIDYPILVQYAKTHPEERNLTELAKSLGLTKPEGY